MITAAVRNLIFAGWAFKQAGLVAATFSRFGFWTAALMLFLCFLANQIVAAWWKGEA